EEGVDDPAEPEKAGIEVKPLGVDYFVSETFRGGPPVDLFFEDQKRQKEEGEDHQSFRGRFGGTANHDSPCASGKVLGHGDQKAGRTGSEPEPEADEIRAEELRHAAADEDTGDKESEENEPDKRSDGRVALQRVNQLRAGRVTLFGRRHCLSG